MMLVALVNVYYKLQTNFSMLRWLTLFLIGIHSMQGWTATTSHGVTRKWSIKRLKHTGNLFKNNI